jgi:hypothetical protein
MLKTTSCIFLFCLCFSTDACTNTPVRKSYSSMQYKSTAVSVKVSSAVRLLLSSERKCCTFSNVDAKTL